MFEKIETFCHEYISQVVQTPYVPIFILNEINRHPEDFLKKLFRNRMPPVEKMIKQIEKEKEQGIIKNVEPFQLLLDVLSLCVFPFVAKPMIQLITRMDGTQFNEMMEHRKKEIPMIIISSIKK